VNAKVMIEECGTGYKEMRLRQIRKKALEVIPKKPGPGPDPPPPTLVPPGAIGIFIAKKGSGVLDQVREAATKGGAVADKFAAKLTSQLKKRKTMSVGDAVDLIAKQSVFADVRYGGATVCNGLFVPKGLDCAVVLLPYNGGRLLADGFQLAEYLQDGTKDGLEGIAVVSQPPLSAAEIAAHLAVPEDQIELNVGFASWCDLVRVLVADHHAGDGRMRCRRGQAPVGSADQEARTGRVGAQDARPAPHGASGTGGRQGLT
jgi:hypothetical protein